MKLAVCTFHTGVTPKDIGGVSFVPIYNTIALRPYFDQVDTVSVRTKVKGEDTKLWEDVISGISNLKDYDYVLFQSFGLTYEKYDEKDPDKYTRLLDEIDKPFSVIVNEENDRKIYPYHMQFVQHPNCRSVVCNCPGAVELFREWEIYTDITYFLPAPPLATKDSIIEKSFYKMEKIMSTSRWTTSKRIFEYISMRDEFEKRGIDVSTAGAHQSHWYNLEMKPLMGSDGNPTWEDIPYFEPHQLPEILKHVKFHWNFLYQKRPMGIRTHQPRVELATLEAFNEGCLPIVCEQFTPDWMGHDGVVRLKREQLLEIPEFISRLSSNDIHDRLDTFYDQVVENIFTTFKDFSWKVHSSL